MISALIGILIIVVVGAICFWAIDKFATDGRLANLLKLLVILVCLGAIVQRVLPAASIASTFDKAKKQTLAVSNSTLPTTVVQGGRRPCFAAITAAISSANLKHIRNGC